MNQGGMCSWVVGGHLLLQTGITRAGRQVKTTLRVRLVRRPKFATACYHWVDVTLAVKAMLPVVFKVATSQVSASAVLATGSGGLILPPKVALQPELEVVVNVPYPPNLPDARSAVNSEVSGVILQ